MTGLPAALRPAWSASSFLAYSGALTVLVSLVALLGDLGDRHGSWGLAGWTALVLVVLVVLSGSFDDGVGLADDVAPLDDDLELAPLLVEVAVLAAAVFAASRLRFPLLMLAATVAQVLLVLDLVAGIIGGGNWLQWAALLLGLVELGIARGLDGDVTRRPWALWKHVAAALLIGTAAVTLLDSGDVGWVVIGLLALGFVGLARVFERSVWAVVGAFGLFLATTYFVDEPETIVDSIPLVPLEGNGDGLELWQTSLVYAGLGAALVLLARWVRQPVLHDGGHP